MLKCLLATLLLLCAVGLAAAQGASGPRLFSRLTINQTHIVFAYAGDIWSVERAGGEAKRLTSNPAEENFPSFSPDGSQLAFSRQVGGNWDVYVMPASGGEARRLTFDPRGEFAIGWTPDNKSILHTSNPNLIQQLQLIQTDGVMPRLLPLPRALLGSYSPDGTRIAYTPSGGISDWRFYRGGAKGQVWLANLADGAVEKLPSGNYNDDQPMWAGDKIYFISDRTGAYNLFSYDLRSKQTKQLTSYEQHGIRWSAAGAGAVAFVRAGRIHVYDAASNQTQVLDVRLTPDNTELKSRNVNVSRNIDWSSVSSDASRIVFGSRGEILTFDPSTGDSKNLSETPGVAERYPTLSPNGRSVAYFSDESGEYVLHVRSLSGEVPLKKIKIEDKPSFYRELTWSPDSKRVAFTDKRLALWVADVDAGTTRRVDTSTYSYQEAWFPNWSPDGRWLTYSKHLHNRVRTVFIYDTQTNLNHQITDGHAHSQSPVFDRGGKYLYFASSPNAGISEFGWGVLNGVVARPLVTRRLHVVILQEGQTIPVSPQGPPPPDIRFDEVLSQVRIDFDNIGQRIIDFNLPNGDYDQLAAGKPGMLYVVVNEWPKSPALGTGPSQSLYLYDLSKAPKLEKLVEEVRGFDISPDGSRLLYVKGRDWFIGSATAAPKPDEGKLDFKKLEVAVEPAAEWKQMYRDSWRIMRDWFYDPNHHGQNLAELERHYAEYLPGITRRSDLNALFNRMLGHISVSHLGVGGGDQPQPAGAPDRTGMLAADYEIDQNRYRFKRIYRTMPYSSPSGFAPAPLDLPGARVKDGEYLIAVEDQNVDASKSVYSYFEGKAGQRVKIKVGPTADVAGARTLTVYALPLQAEAQIRRANWSEQNRRLVEKLSGGKLGYIYVADYGAAINDFIRGLTGYSERPGLIIDQRFNGGGITPDYLIEWLRRKPIYDYAFREGEDIPVPVNPGPAVKVLVTNENNFSAAETFAFMYKLAKVGPIVGTRTGGGGIGPYVFTPSLIDGGNVQLPNRAAYNPDGTSWGVENVGVVPDFEVEFTPRDWMAGRDPQLEKAVQVAMEELKKAQTWSPKRPKYPIHK
ncbi:MAG TPA: S41 family peptidase [Pyrinomonadaceae bacterium]|nr:S41 family peptidase [Pyrinomonadaceae bacterium]